MVVLRICGVDCYYGSVKVLENVSFTIKSGEFIGLLGPNGSGKTTLLRTISRTLKPRVGAVYLDEVELFSMSSREVAKNIAVVPQSSSLSFNFTALEVVLMGRHPHLGRFKLEDEKDLAVARRAMEMTNTWHLAERWINELSGGERQRVMIARALAQEPKVLLLDEPTTHLDINSQLEVMDLLKELCVKNGLIALAVFHDFNLAARYCDSLILLKDGRIVSIGSVENVLTSENIKKVFNVDVIVKKHPLTNSLYVITVSSIKPTLAKGRSLSIHLICGAGTGSALMKSLIENGYRVTAGVLNVLDTDYETAQLLKIPVVSEAPFSPITDENYKANLEMASGADVVVVTSVPFGRGNLRNLEVALKALEKGVHVCIINEEPIEKRDFTGGEARKYFLELSNRGAIFIKDRSELMLLLDRMEREKIWMK
ncbi:MAG: ABC transporter ATP-binding protein [Candidatus Bathyarchaeia archaeon]